MAHQTDDKTEKFIDLLQKIIDEAPTSEAEVIQLVAKLGWSYLNRHWDILLIAGTMQGVGHAAGHLAFTRLVKLSKHLAAKHAASKAAQNGPWGPRVEATLFDRFRDWRPASLGGTVGGAR